MRVFAVLILVSLVVLFELAGCGTGAATARAGSVPALRPGAAPPESAGLSPAEVLQGNQLHTEKCARCHKLYDPAPYTDAKWNLWMTKMSKKAHLTVDQQQVLTRYLGAFRSREASDGR
jgi:hypothetical protein